jgi:hypothetical protein
MTTIAANLECMAADTRVSFESGGHYPATKIFRIGESLFGTAGDGFMCLLMVEWLKGPRNMKARLNLYKQFGEYDRDLVEIIELNATGLYLWTGWGLPEKILADRAAVGSGAKAALTAMSKGDSPEAAVTAAIEHDIYTAAPVQVEYLLPPELTKRKRRG